MTERRDRIGADSTVLVTGASSGIGEAVARALAGFGCRLVLAARRVDRLAVLAASLNTPALAWPLDVREDAAIDALPGALPEPFRQVDVLVNNAGHDAGGRRPFVEGKVQDWTDIIDTNLRAVLRITRAMLPGMLERGRGDIVNLGSTSGIRSYPNITAYGASKAALHMFSDNLRTELSGTGVRVIEIQPGPVRSGFAEVRMRGDAAAIQRYWAEMSDDLPLECQDVADMVVFALTRPRHVTLSQIVMQPSAKC